MLIVGAITAYRSIWAQMGRYRWALVGAAVVGTLAILGPWTPFPVLLYELPLVAEVRELGRYSILVYVVLCLVFAFALQAVTHEWASGAGSRPRGGSGACVWRVGCWRWTGST